MLIIFWINLYWCLGLFVCLNGLFGILEVVWLSNKLFGYKYDLLLGKVGCFFIGCLFMRLVVLKYIVCSFENVSVLLLIVRVIVFLIDLINVFDVLFC